MNLRVLFLMLVCVLCGCTHKKEQEKGELNKNLKSGMIVMDTLLDKPLFYNQTPVKSFTVKDKYKVYRQGKAYPLSNNINEASAEVYDLDITVNSYKKGKSFIYDYETLVISDTLQFCNDSVVLNKKVLKPIGSKNIKYNNTLYTIKKYAYHKSGIMHSPFINFFINDSLGILLGQYVGQSNGIKRYGTQPKFYKIQDEIIKDSIFFEFK